MLAKVRFKLAVELHSLKGKLCNCFGSYSSCKPAAEVQLLSVLPSELVHW